MVGYAMFGYAMFGFVNLEDSQGAIADPPRRRLRFNVSDACRMPTEPWSIRTSFRKPLRSIAFYSSWRLFPKETKDHDHAMGTIYIYV